MNYIYIFIVAVFISDISGFTDTASDFIQRAAHLRQPPSLKPLSCPLCLTWWAELSYIVITGRLSAASVAAAAGLAVAAPLVADAVRLCIRILQTLINVKNEKLDRF